MANLQSYNIILDKGLDYVTPPLLAEAGSLVDTRNYELSAHTGYRRIDGYERRDNHPDGGISKWYQVTFNSPPTLVPGDKMQYILNGDQIITVGVVLDVIGNVVRYVPLNGTQKLKVGQVVEGRTVTVATVDGRTIITDPALYIQSVRNYSAVLRALVADAPSDIAGTYYSRTFSYEVLDAPFVHVQTAGPTTPPIGVTVRYNGFTYEVIKVTTINPRRWYLRPRGTSGIVDTSVTSTLSGATVYAAAGQVISFNTSNSEYGVLVQLADYSIFRGHDFYLTPAWSFKFTGGTFAGGGYPPDGNYYITTAGGGTNIAQGDFRHFVKETGVWSSGTATGRMTIASTYAGSAARDYPILGDEIHTIFPVTGSSRIGTISTAPELAVLAGTAALRRQETRYQWGTYNFYASPTKVETYGTNGVYRAFWADNSSYGNIYTQDDSTLDNPKYLTFHSGVQLGLGFDAGSFQLSVGGEPYNFNGFDGALEIGTGDEITGLLESQDDSTIVFGKRSIRRVTGTTDTTLALGTVSANAGAFNYTAVNVGTIPVFTGPTGVSTLSQTAAYGDFIGERATSLVYNWLNPKLVPNLNTSELGGVACALPVRNKNQYRLFLNTGDVVNVTFSADGTKVMRSDYTSNDGTTNVPLAWGSSVSDEGDEHVEVVWDYVLSDLVREPSQGTANPRRAYRLDWGWGFDGEQFPHYFDISWSFPTQADTNVTIDQVRLYGAGYGQASLNVKTSGIEEDFDQDYFERLQDISLPAEPVLLRDELYPVTDIIDVANWGLGIKVRIGAYPITVDNIALTEPIHVAQVLKLRLSNEGTGDQ